MTEEVLYQRCPSMSENLRGKDEQNWLKCTIAAFTAKDALVKFATYSFTNFYEDVRQTIVNTKGIGKHITCSACTIDKKGQLHTHGQCPGICVGIHDLIWNNHRFKRTGPSWGNTDSTKWCTNSWELAKCYMPETGYREKDADTTDFNGIISAVYNCTWVETLFADNLNQPDNVCTKARIKVNELRHINIMKISDADMNSFFDSLLNLLDDQRYLHGFAPAVTAHSYLNQLRKNSLLLADSTIIDTVEHMKAALIQEKDESMIAKISSILNNLYENKKDELQKYLIQFYQDHHSSVPLNMLCEEIDIRLEHIHVSPKISELKREKSVEPKSIYSYHDMFFHDTLHSRRIYLQGEAGTGKSTFCTQLAQDWCKSHGADVIQQSKTTAINPNETNQINTQEFSDLDTLRTFRFLFFVSLQSMNGLECDVSEMITRTLGTKWDERFWQDECLIVRDGADEWNHPKIDGKTCKCTNDRQLPPEKVMGNVTFLTTSRPWKLANARLSDTMTRTFEIYGISDADSLIERVLIAQGKTESHIIEFKNIVLKYKLKESMQIPVIAMQLIHQYISGYELTSSRFVIYTNLLDMHVARALSKQNLESFDKNQTVCHPLPDLLKKRDICLNKNSATIYELSNLAFHELLSREHISDIVFSEEQIALFVKIGIVTQRKSMALNPPKRNAYTFQHKTVQEFLAAVYLFMKSKSQDSNDPMEQVLCQIKQTYHSEYNISGLQQIFIFTCGLYAEAAERLYQHIMDIATVGLVEFLKKSFLKNKKPAAVRLNTLKFVTHLILDGISEGRASKQTSLRLNLTYVNDNDFLKEDSNPLETELIDLNKDNMSIVCSSQRPLVPIKHLLECFSQTITVLMLNRYTSDVEYDLSGLIHLQFLYLSNNITISNIGARNLIGCSLENVTAETENYVFNTAQLNWKDSLEYFYIIGCRNTELFVQMIGNIKNLKSLHFGKFSQIHRIISNHDTVIDLSKVVCCSLHVDPFIESTILRSLFQAGSSLTLLKIKGCKNEQRLLAALPKSGPTENVQKLNTKDLEECTLIHVDPLIESAILRSLLLQTGNNIRRLVIKGCQNEELLLTALPYLCSLDNLDVVCIDANSAMFTKKHMSLLTKKESFLMEKLSFLKKEQLRSFGFCNFTFSELTLTALTQIQNIQNLTIANTEQTNAQCRSNKYKTIEHMHKINTKNLKYCTLIHVDHLIESAILQSLSHTGNNIKRLVIKGCKNEELLLFALPNLSSLEFLDAMCGDTNSTMLKKVEQSFLNDLNEENSFLKEENSFLKEKRSFLKERNSFLKEQSSFLKEQNSFLKSFLKKSVVKEKETLLKEEKCFLKKKPSFKEEDQFISFRFCNFTFSEIILTTLSQIQNIQKLTIENTEQTNASCLANKSRTTEHMQTLNTKHLKVCTLIYVDPSIESTILQSLLHAGNNIRRLVIKGCNNEELLLSAIPNLSCLDCLDVMCGNTNSDMFKMDDKFALEDELSLLEEEQFSSFRFCNFTFSCELILTTLSQIQNIQILTIDNTKPTNSQCRANKSRTTEHMPNLNTHDLKQCILIHVDPLIESKILQSLLQTENNIKRLVIKGCNNEELLLSALPNMCSLHSLDAVCGDANSDMLMMEKLSFKEEDQFISFRFCNFTFSELILTTLLQIQNIQKLTIENTEQTNAQCRTNKSRTTEHMPNLNTKHLEECILIHVDPLIEGIILQSLLHAGNNIRRLVIKGCNNEELLLSALPNLSSLDCLDVMCGDTNSDMFKMDDMFVLEDELSLLEEEQFSSFRFCNFTFSCELILTTLSQIQNIQILTIDNTKPTNAQCRANKSRTTEHMPNLNTHDLKQCILIHVDPLIESKILQSLLQTENNIKRLVIKGCNNEELLLSALPNMCSLQGLDAVCGNANSDLLMMEKLSFKEEDQFISFRFCNFTFSELILTTLLQIQNIKKLKIENIEQTNAQCLANKTRTTEHMPNLNTKHLEECILIQVDPLIESAILQSLLQTGNNIKRLVIKGCTNEELLLSALPNLSSLDYLDAMCIDTYSAMLKMEKLSFKEEDQFMSFIFCNFTFSELILTTLLQIQNIQKLKIENTEQTNAQCLANKSRTTEHMPNLNTKHLEECILIQVDPLIESTILRSLLQTGNNIRRLVIKGCTNEELLLAALPNLCSLHNLDVVCIDTNSIMFKKKEMSFLKEKDSFLMEKHYFLKKEQLRSFSFFNFTFSELTLTALTQIQNIQNLTIANTEQTNAQWRSNKSKTIEHMHKINTKDLEYCTLIHVDPLIESAILQSLSHTGNNIKRLVIKGCKNEELLLCALPNLSSLEFLDVMCGDTNSAMLKKDELFFLKEERSFLKEKQSFLKEEKSFLKEKRSFLKNKLSFLKKEQLSNFRFCNFTFSELILTTLLQIKNIQKLKIENTEQTNAQCRAIKSRTTEHMQNLNTKDLKECILIHVDPLIESTILQSLLQAGNKIRRLVIKGCTNEELVLNALPNLSSLDYLDAMCIDTYSAMLKKDELFYLKDELALLKKEQLSSFSFCNFTFSELLLTTLSQIQRIQKLKIQNTEQTNAQCRANKSRTTEHMPNLNTKDLEECILIYVDPLIESTILQSFLQAGNNLRRLEIKGCNNEKLFLDAFPFTIIQ